ncbi:MAG: flagellar basal body-associated protein FliL [Rhizobacter sp.]
MSDDAAEATAPPPPGKKKALMAIIAVVVLLVVAAGAMLYLKKKAAADDSAEPGAAAMHKPGHRADPAHPPTFLTLDPFIINLGDRDADRYAQIGIVLEVDSQEFAEQMRAYMPAIRNNILMVIAHKNSRELLERKGKERLAQQILRETVRPMGIDIPSPEKAKAVEPSEDEDDEADAPKRRAPERVYNPVRHVHFSSFIIQ